jgi:uncharacterized damage-inducible protein DinB
MHQLVNDKKALRTLRKTPTILSAIVAGLSEEQARTRRDGADGWSIHTIVCHMADVEGLFTQRVRDLRDHDQPTFTVITNEELMRQPDYEGQTFAGALATYHERRTAFIALLESLTDEQWLRTGLHPLQGPATVLDVAINTGLHDIDHREQIIRCRETN